MTETLAITVDKGQALTIIGALAHHAADLVQDGSRYLATEAFELCATMQEQYGHPFTTEAVVDGRTCVAWNREQAARLRREILADACDGISCTTSDHKG